jgi:type II secretory pathway component PulF
MPRFDWKGRHQNGQAVSGTLEADTKEQVLAQLRGQGIQLQSLSTSDEEGFADPALDRAQSGSGPSPRTLRLILVGVFLLAMLLIMAVPFLRVIF